MGKKWISALTHRALALALSLVVGVTFMPMLNGQVFAEEENEQKEGQQVEVTAESSEPDVDETLGEKEDAEATTKAVQESPAREEGAAQKTPDQKEVSKSAPTVIADDKPKGKSLGEEPDTLKGNTQAVSYTVSAPNSRGFVTVKGSLTGIYSGCTFYSVYVDNSMVKGPGELGTSTIDISIDMKKYPVGFHTITVYVLGTDGKLYHDKEQKAVPTYIYSRPANGFNQYEVYSNYFFFKTGSAYADNKYLTQYIEYRQVGTNNWKLYSMDKGNNTYQFKGLKPNTNYQARVYYGTSFTYGGKDYFWKSPYSPVRSFKTGVATTPIKSFKLKAYKVKKHKVKNTHYYVGYFRTYKYKTKYVYYTYRLKAIVTFKKKPGASGVNICGVWVKGNKKKYTVKLGGTWTSYVKPKKLKKTVSVYTYQNRAYGGYSPLYKATKKQK